jgi:hypothetical protein
MSFGGVFMPSDPRERARKAREEFEGMYWWNPTMEGFSEEMKKKEQFGAVPVDGREYYEPVSTPEGDYYAVQTWSPMIPESYPGMFWDPATGKLSTQAEIMKRLKWPTMGGIPYQYNPRRRRGFMGMEYPLVQGSYGTQWGYGAEEDSAVKAGQAIWCVGVVTLLGIGAWLVFRDWQKAKMEEARSRPTIEEWNRSLEE